MHDDLGANLTQIALLGELTRRDSRQPAHVETHAARISDTARELVQAMDEIVWAVNPKNDTVRGLAAYLFQFAEEFLALTPIRCRVDAPAVLPERPLTADARHSLFLVVKEALNNAVKHSSATEVWVRLAIVGSEIAMSVEDNGRGFSPAAAGPLGNGLANMQKRLEEVGGRLRLESWPGAGTKVHLTLRLK